MLLGARLGMSGGASAPIVRLDWIKGSMTSYVITDWLLDSVAYTFDIRYVKEDYESNSDGRWPAIVSAGGQDDYNFMFGVTNFAKSSTTPIPNCWVHNWIYQSSSKLDTKMMEVNLFLKKNSETYGVDDLYATHNGSAQFKMSTPRWTTARQSSSQTLNFLCAVLGDGTVTQQCKKVRFIEFTIKDGNTVKAHFYPAMQGDVAGVYEDVDGVFYPETGTLTCCLDGEVLER